MWTHKLNRYLSKREKEAAAVCGAMKLSIKRENFGEFYIVVVVGAELIALYLMLQRLSSFEGKGEGRTNVI